jgi:hypothetical protein
VKCNEKKKKKKKKNPPPLQTACGSRTLTQASPLLQALAWPPPWAAAVKCEETILQIEVNVKNRSFYGTVRKKKNKEK